MNKIKTYIRPKRFLISDKPYFNLKRIQNSIEIHTTGSITIFVDDHQCYYDIKMTKENKRNVFLCGIRNGRRMKKILEGNGKFYVLSGDSITLFQCSVFFRNDKIRICGEFDTNILPAFVIEPEQYVTENFTRSPRIIESPVKEVISLNLTRTDWLPVHQGMLKRILPSLGMIITSVVISLITGRGLVMLACVCTSLIVILTTVADAVHDRAEYNKTKRDYEAAAEQEILKAKRNYINLKMREQQRMINAAPSPTRIYQMIEERSSKIYERKVTDPDFLQAALGYTQGISNFKIQCSEVDNLSKNNDALESMAREISDKSMQTDKILTIDFCGISVGMIGKMTILTEQLRNLILFICFFHSYHDLQIVILADDTDFNFEWMRYLPHTNLVNFQCTGVLTSFRLKEQTGTRLEKLLNDRKKHEWKENRKIHYAPHLLFVVIEADLNHHQGLMRCLLEDETQDYSMIWLAETEDKLPENATTMVKYLDETHGVLRSVKKQAVNIPFNSFSSMKLCQYEWAARNLRVFHHITEKDTGIPSVVDFFKMMQIFSHQEIDFLKLWEKEDPSVSLAVPLGMRDMTHMLSLDLHEKAHGPHGLIAGTTGSGKSELLQSLILSLAVHFSPFDVGFLLIDYKGGGMADVFERLPHLMGIITNLEAAEGERAMSSIKAELLHRQKIFHKFHVNHIDEYMALYKEKNALEPLPHLIIICDEFAELKKEHGQIIKELISTARLGRSLGIHLILATQKPSGIVDDQIWSNTRFRIALRMAEESDSKEILKTPDAASIKNPGRAYLQVGNNEIYELFQSAYSSGIFDASESNVNELREIYKLNDLGQRIKIRDDKFESVNGRNTKTEVMCITEAIHSFFSDWIKQQPNRVMPHRPWLPVLGKILLMPDQFMHSSTEMTENQGIVMFQAYMGMVDLPESQAQRLYERDLLACGHIAYYAAEGYGKTTWLITQALSFAHRYPPSLLNFYMLDLSGGDLIRLKPLVHTADYIAMDDDEKFERFRRLIEDELKRRKHLLSNCNAVNFREFNSRKKNPLKLIVIMIDQADAIREIGIQAEDLIHRIAREGTALGILLMMTLGRNGGVRYATMNHISQKIFGYINSDSDSGLLTGATKQKIEEIPGRCLIKFDKNMALMQLFTVEISGSKLMTEIKNINTIFGNDHADSIPMMPEEVDLDIILNRQRKIAHKIQNKFEISENQKRYSKKYYFYIGLTLNEVMPSGVMRNDMPLLILGDTGRGKTNLLKLILNQQAMTVDCYLIDSRKKELYGFRNIESVTYRDTVIDKKVIIYEMNHLAKMRENMMHQDLVGYVTPSMVIDKLPEIWLLIDNIDDLINGMSTEDLVQLSESIEILINTGVCLFVTANPQKLKGYDPMTRLVKGIQNGVLLSGQGMHNIFPLKSYRDEPDMKNGILFISGIGVGIRVAKGEDLNERNQFE